MKLLIADSFPDAGRHALDAAGHHVTYAPKTTAEELPLAITDHDVLVVRSTKVSRATLEAGRRLQLVVRAGAGVNTIDVAAASALGVFVSNTPGKNAIAVAELTIGLLLALDRRIPSASAELHAGRWNKKEYSRADGLFGKTLGIVGFGPIGREVAVRARALGMRVLAWSRSLDDDSAEGHGVSAAPSLLALAERSDAVSVHLAFATETQGLLGADFFSHLPARAMLVNTSRGGIVDENALATAMRERGVRYATDVFAGEPAADVAEFTSALLAAGSGIIATPHIGASTEQAQSAVADETVRVIRRFAESGQVPNCVNLCAQSPARWQLNVRHLDRVGVLAHVLGALRERSINVEELENVIFDGAKAACARIRLGSEPAPEVVEAIARQEHVLDARLLRL